MKKENTIKPERREFLKKTWAIPMFIMLGPLDKDANAAAGGSGLGGGNGQGGGWGAGGNPKS